MLLLLSFCPSLPEVAVAVAAAGLPGVADNGVAAGVANAVEGAAQATTQQNSRLRREFSNHAVTLTWT